MTTTSPPPWLLWTPKTGFRLVAGPETEAVCVDYARCKKLLAQRFGSLAAAAAATVTLSPDDVVCLRACMVATLLLHPGEFCGHRFRMIDMTAHQDAVLGTTANELLEPVELGWKRGEQH